MRVISGKAKGKKLLSPIGQSTRPTSDRIKESMFNILSSRNMLQNATVLDLFCGSGALGIEAYSVGAKSVVFADADLSCVNLTKQNLQRCGMGELCKNVFLADFHLALKKLQDSEFDLVLLDPPYKKGYEEDIFCLISRHNILARNGAIMLEHDKKLVLPSLEGFYFNTRFLGNTALSLITRQDD